MGDLQRPGGQTDRDIEQRIHDLFALDSRLNPANIRVHVADGKVRLTGVAFTDEDRQRAWEIARSVPGVTEVQDEMVTVPMRESRH